jgi:hypothetical protein
VKQIKLIFASGAATTLMMLAASPPALTNHKPDRVGVVPLGDWWCLTQWEQRYNENWRLEFFGC